MDDGDVAKTMTIIGELEEAVRTLQKAMATNAEVTRLQNETIGIMLPVLTDMMTDPSLPDHLRRRTTFALQQITGIGKRVLAL